MHRQSVASQLIVLASLLTALANAAPNDQAAESQIDRAINEQYLATEFRAAVDTLRNAIEQCSNGRCSPTVLAKAWMYLGVVQGNALKDQQEAQRSFTKAFSVSANVQLDDELATPETKASFSKALASRPTASKLAASISLPPGVSRLDCRLEVSEVETRRPIPISCAVAKDSATTELSYMGPGSPEFARLPLLPNQGRLVALIPCKDTMGTGELFMFATAKDRSGEQVVARWGTPEEPVRLLLVEASAEPPPAFAGEEPPERCPGEACEPGTPGCDALARRQGPPCRIGADCETGSCTNGFCDLTAEDEETGPFPFFLNWVGLHVGFDLAVFTGTRMCAVEGYDDDFRCYTSEGQLVATNVEGYQPYFSSSVSSAFGTGPIRLLLSYDRMLTQNWSAGGRVGWAFGGAPRLFEGFLPLHLELIGAYWLQPTTAPGLRPYLALGGGLAQSDFKVAVKNQLEEDGETYDYDAYRQMGRAFIKLGAGAVLPVGNSLGLQLNLQGMLYMPTSGWAVQPSLGVVTGL